MSTSRVHIADLDIGEPFRYSPGGELFARVGAPADPIRVARLAAPPGTPPARAESAFVYRAAAPAGRDGGGGGTTDDGAAWSLLEGGRP